MRKGTISCLLANNTNNQVSVETHKVNTNKIIGEKVIIQKPAQPMIIKVKRINFLGQIDPDKEFTFKIYKNPKNQEELKKIVAEKMTKQFSQDIVYHILSYVIIFILIALFMFMVMSRVGGYIPIVFIAIIVIITLSLLFIDNNSLTNDYKIKTIQKFKPAEYTFKETFNIQNNKLFGLIIKNQIVEPCQKKICKEKYLILLSNIYKELNKLNRYKIVTVTNTQNNIQKVISKPNCLILLRTKSNTEHKIKEVIIEHNNRCSRQDILNDSNIYPLKINQKYFIDIYTIKETK